MARIFISYRRDDSQAIADRIYERLAATFGARNVFKDVDDIPPGKDFRTVLQDAVVSSDVMLVIIGRQWSTIAGPDGYPRLHNPGDFVRLEIERALQKPHMTVIPVLVNNAQLPSVNVLPPSLHELVYRNAMTVRNDPDFAYDIDRLMRHLQGKRARKEERPPVERYTPEKAKRSRGCIGCSVRSGCLGILGVAVIVFALYAFTAGQDGQSIDPCGEGSGMLLNTEQTWWLDDGAGSTIGIQFSGLLGGSFDVSIYGPEGYLLAEGWSGDDSDGVAVQELQLPQSGTYKIVVSGSRFMPYDISLFGACGY